MAPRTPVTTRERDELPKLARAADRHIEQQAHHRCVGEAPHRHHGDPWQAVGELPSGQREERHGSELRQADQAEIEGAVVDRVDLPADRDRGHLHRQARAEHRRPETAEVAVQEGGRQREQG